MMIEIAGTIAMVLAVGGVLLNNRKMIACFPIWMVSNAICLGIHATTGVVMLAVRDAVFIALAIAGWRRWRKKGGE